LCSFTSRRKVCFFSGVPKMRGEEFFGEVKEERLIDRELSWVQVINVVVILSVSIGLYLWGTPIRIESLWSWSYWLEVTGFALIVGELLFEENIRKWSSYGEGWFTPGDDNFVGWRKTSAFIAAPCVIGASFSAWIYSVADGEIGKLLREIFHPFFVWEMSVLLGLFLAISGGAYVYVLSKTNDRLFAKGVGLAVPGLTFATSAQITTTFF
jgi:hypothetical protein